MYEKCALATSDSEIVDLRDFDRGMRVFFEVDEFQLKQFCGSKRELFGGQSNYAEKLSRHVIESSLRSNDQHRDRSDDFSCEQRLSSRWTLRQ